MFRARGLVTLSPAAQAAGRTCCARTRFNRRFHFLSYFFYLFYFLSYFFPDYKFSFFCRRILLIVNRSEWQHCTLSGLHDVWRDRRELHAHPVLFWIRLLVRPSPNRRCPVQAFWRARHWPPMRADHSAVRHTDYSCPEAEWIRESAVRSDWDGRNTNSSILCIAWDTNHIGCKNCRSTEGRKT